MGRLGAARAARPSSSRRSCRRGRPPRAPCPGRRRAKGPTRARGADPRALDVAVRADDRAAARRAESSDAREGEDLAALARATVAPSSADEGMDDDVRLEPRPAGPMRVVAGIDDRRAGVERPLERRAGARSPRRPRGRARVLMPQASRQSSASIASTAPAPRGEDLDGVGQVVLAGDRVARELRRAPARAPRARSSRRRRSPRRCASRAPWRCAPRRSAARVPRGRGRRGRTRPAPAAEGQEGEVEAVLALPRRSARDSVSAVSSGASPERIDDRAAARRRAPRAPRRAASPVPSGGSWTTSVTGAAGQRCLDLSPARADDHDDRARATSSSAVSRTASRSVRPPTRWRTLGSEDRMREPTPAARTMTWARPRRRGRRVGRVASGSLLARGARGVPCRESQLQARPRAGEPASRSS